MKVLGAFLCLLAPTAAGILHAVRLVRRERLIRGLCRFAAALEEGVAERALDQREIYERLEDKVLTERGLTALLLQETENCPAGALDRSITRFFQAFDPGKATRDAWLAFARRFGSLGCEEQIRDCRRLSEEMRGISDKERKDLWDRARLSVTMGLCVGGGILILLG